MINILDGVDVDEAVDTIKQHHPNECVWCEFQRKATRYSDLMAATVPI